jgi:hypothetical protein
MAYSLSPRAIRPARGHKLTQIPESIGINVLEEQLRAVLLQPSGAHGVTRPTTPLNRLLRGILPHPITGRPIHVSSFHDHFAAVVRFIPTNGIKDKISCG